MNNQLRRNQFILGPRFLETFAGWRQVKIGHWHLTAHPNLSVCQVTNGDKWAALIGYALDSKRPKATDADILADLLQDGPISFLERIDKLGGRWVLILNNGQSTRLFHDACGSRQVFYSADPLWCASQPELIANVLGLDIDPEADDFLTLQLVKGDPEAWWPGDSSPYKEVRALLPNHHLNLDEAQTVRYWPRQVLPPLTLENGAQAVADTLQGIVKAAAHRFDLCLSLSAGYDSRCILAASRAVIDDLSFSTIAQMNRSHRNNVDIAIAEHLVNKFCRGKQLDVIEETPTIDRHIFDFICRARSIRTSGTIRRRKATTTAMATKKLR
jgi:hypothetical protein